MPLIITVPTSKKTLKKGALPNLRSAIENANCNAVNEVQFQIFTDKEELQEPISIKVKFNFVS